MRAPEQSYDVDRVTALVTSEILRSSAASRRPLPAPKSAIPLPYRERGQRRLPFDLPTSSLNELGVAGLRMSSALGGARRGLPRGPASIRARGGGAGLCVASTLRRPAPGAVSGA